MGEGSAAVWSKIMKAREGGCDICASTVSPGKEHASRCVHVYKGRKAREGWCRVHVSKERLWEKETYLSDL